MRLLRSAYNLLVDYCFATDNAVDLLLKDNWWDAILKCLDINEGAKIEEGGLCITGNLRH